MILVNGFPKSGTHALQKGVELLGVPASQISLAHVPATGLLPDGLTHHLVIVRHPRNCLISQVRFRGRPITQGSCLQMIREYGPGAGPLAQELAGYLPWLQSQKPWLRSAPHVVRYEDLLRDDRALRGVAERLGVPYLEDAFPNLPGLTRTWSGAPSAWSVHWTAEIERVWTEQGLPELEQALGY